MSQVARKLERKSSRMEQLMKAHKEYKSSRDNSTTSSMASIGNQVAPTSPPKTNNTRAVVTPDKREVKAKNTAGSTLPAVKETEEERQRRLSGITEEQSDALYPSVEKESASKSASANQETVTTPPKEMVTNRVGGAQQAEGSKCKMFGTDCVIC
mmetsp:Transcript_16581/g.29750  ORF Transcript_16581/g.29750 Transcript_16581/m.29750 type:complete len:155 (+) Transcript_16581:153-617(+)|eukprot:CAMPEP_0197523760 /NCGR_PEP_ID=MMETSP1318-20131121/8612_1 /TAXON_ID=552666 /ORGANISM="Partenskyella glossopodia, Strain RCC365" /LENGTH=154 /DNA_ID=CAMNT_0043076551 /DNA_START=106 /DNA_END=570 /DNA_ORIENTATION=+